MSLAPYVLKGAIKRALGFFNSITTTGINTESVVTGLIASTTHTIAGATPLTAAINKVSTVANIGDAGVLMALTPGQSQIVYNDGANAMAVFPGTAAYSIDGGSAGASVTLTNAKRCKYTCIATNVIESAQLGAISA